MPDFIKSNFSQNSEVETRIKKAAATATNQIKVEHISGSYNVLTKTCPVVRQNNLIISNNILVNIPANQKLTIEGVFIG